MKTTFYLRKIDGTDEGIIHFLFTQKKDKIRISTGIKLKVSNWKNGQLTKSTSNLAYRNQLNHYREFIDRYIYEFLRTTNSLPNRVLLKKQCKLLIKGEVQQNEDFLISKLLDQMICEQSNPTSDSKINLSTIRYKRIHFKHFSKSIGRAARISELNQDLVNHYRIVLHNDQNQNVTKNNYRKSIISFINWCKKKGFIDPKLMIEFLKFDKVIKPIISLKENELSKIESSVFPETEQKQIDIFLFGCYTTLAISDIRRVKKEMVIDNILYFPRKKTDWPIKIPLVPQAIKILEKYNYNLPHIHPNKGPEVLKKAFKRIELDRTVVLVTKTGKENSKYEYVPLYKTMSWHKARKTAITLAIRSKISIDTIANLAGFGDPKTLKVYIDHANIPEDEFLEKFRKYPKFDSQET
jgi:integrase